MSQSVVTGFSVSKYNCTCYFLPFLFFDPLIYPRSLTPIGALWVWTRGHPETIFESSTSHHFGSAQLQEHRREIRLQGQATYGANADTEGGEVVGYFGRWSVFTLLF